MFRRNKKTLIIILAVITAAAVYYHQRKGETPLDSEIIAKVNGRPILLSAFEERLAAVKMNYPPDKAERMPEIKQTILRRMIIEELILQDAEERNIKVTRDELKREINSIRQNYTDDEFSQLLMNQFKTNEDWTAEVKHRLLIEKTLSKEVIDKINVSDVELKQRYDSTYANKLSEPKVKLAQIFTTSKETAAAAETELKGGADFESLARKYSESPEAAKGGLVGTMIKGEGLEIFDKAFQMKDGEVSPIMQSEHGFHILKVIQHIPPLQMSFEEAKPFILNELVREKESKYYQDWLEKRFKSSKILKNTVLMDSIK